MLSSFKKIEESYSEKELTCTLMDIWSVLLYATVRLT